MDERHWVLALWGLHYFQKMSHDYEANSKYTCSWVPQLGEENMTRWQTYSRTTLHNWLFSHEGWRRSWRCAKTTMIQTQIRWNLWGDEICLRFGRQFPVCEHYVSIVYHDVFYWISWTSMWKCIYVRYIQYKRRLILFDTFIYIYIYADIGTCCAWVCVGSPQHYTRVFFLESVPELREAFDHLFKNHTLSSPLEDAIRVYLCALQTGFCPEVLDLECITVLL